MKIILIHGMFMSRTINFFFLKKRLKKEGYTDIHSLSYSSLKTDLNGAYTNCYSQLCSILIDEFEQPLIIIGYSLGGIIAKKISKMKFLNIKKLIIIASPINSCYLLDKMEEKFKDGFLKLFNNDMVKDLSKRIECTKEEPCVPYCTITTSLPFSKSFDGRINVNDTIINKKYNYHINNGSHEFIMIDKRCFDIIVENIKNINE